MGKDPEEMSKAELLAEYKRMKKADHPLQKCLVCLEKGMKKGMDPHHIKGRHGTNMLLYRWVHKPCHRMIHDDPETATKHGWLIAGRNT